MLRADKDAEWGKWNMDWWERKGLEQIAYKYKRLLKNYKLANGIIDKSDYIVEEDIETADLMNMILDENDDSALELKFYPIIPNVINVLTGEFAKRNDKILYRAIDDKSFNEMMEQKRQMIEDYLMQYGNQKMQENIKSMGLDMESEEGQQQAQQMMSPESVKSLPEIEQFFTKTYRSVVETWATHQHNVDMERFYMNELETIAFKDMLITDSEFWHFKMNEDDYEIELWNPILTFYYKSPETRYISDGSVAGKINVLTVADVIDQFGHKMTQDELESLEEMNPISNMKYILPGLQNDGSFYDSSKSHAWNTEGPSLGMRQFTSFKNTFNFNEDVIDEVLGQNKVNDEGISSNKCRVTQAYWKSQRLVGHVTKITDEGFVNDMFVDEKYKVTTKPTYNNTLLKEKSRLTLIYGEHIDWLWINEVWGGTKIGPNKSTSNYGTNTDDTITPIYLDVKPLRFQFKGDYTNYGCKLPVEGAVFSERNSKSTSLVDKMKPYQLGYNMVNNQVQDILVDELGTVILLDQNALPQSSMNEDWGKNNLAKAYVAMKDFQMLPLDTTMSNTESPVSFQHYQVLNLEQTNRLLSRIQLANYFKQQCFESIGLSPQRMASVSSQETASGIEQAINMSYTQTEMYFVNHAEHLMPKVHQMRTDLAQHYNSTNPSVRLQYMTSAEEKVNFEINGTELLARDLNVYITTKINQRALLENMKSLALNNNTSGANIYDLGNILKADSLAEVDSVMKDIEKKTNTRVQQEQQHAQQMQQQAIEAENAKWQRDAEFKASESEKDRESNLETAKIKAAGFGSMMDINENKQSDYIDALEYFDKKEADESKRESDEKDRDSKIMIEGKKLQQKDKDRASKEKIAATQLQIAKENKNKYDKKS
jgi:hypothetical protein